MRTFQRPNQARRRRPTQINVRVTDETKAQLEALCEFFDTTITEVLEWVIEGFADAANQSPPNNGLCVFSLPDETDAQLDVLSNALGMSVTEVLVQAIAAFNKTHDLARAKV
jgi:predicted transcriptional regulator